MQSPVSGNRHWSQDYERGIHHTLGHPNTSSVTCVLAMQTHAQTAHETCLSSYFMLSVSMIPEDLSFKYEENKDTRTLALTFCRGEVRSPHHVVVIIPFCSNEQFLSFTRQSLLKNVAYFVTFSIICIGIPLSHSKGQ